MVPDDPLTDSQPEPDPPFLGREEGGEDLLERLAVNPQTRIPDGNAHRVAGVALNPRRPDGQRAALRHRLNGVEGDVQDDLVDLFLICLLYTSPSPRD